MTGHLVRLSPDTTSPRLLCLPYAGGRGDAYRRWVPDFHGALELWSLDLPGRHRRSGEPAPDDLHAAARGIAGEALDLLDRPLAVFGHSMGALLGIEVARLLERDGIRLDALFVSGCAAPHLRALRPAPADRSDAALVDLLRSWGGTPTELLDDREFLAVAVPPLRADMRLCDGYRDRPATVHTPLLAFAGRDDRTAPVGEVRAWSACTTDWRGLHVVPGNHFFIHSAQPAVTSVIAATVRTLATRAMAATLG